MPSTAPKLTIALLAIVSSYVCDCSVVSAAALTWTGQTGAVVDANWTTNAANKNWMDMAGMATSFNDGDVVFFEENIPGTSAITVQAAGVTPFTMTFRHTARLYELSGGPIKGNNTAMHIEAFAPNGPGGTVKLSNANTYGGGTNLSGGILIVANNSALGTGEFSVLGSVNPAIGADGTPRTLSNNLQLTGGGVLTIFGEELKFTGATEILHNVGLKITNNKTTFSGVIADGNIDGMPFPGSLTKSGPGTLVLTGANTYSDGTTVNQGTLFVGPSGSATGTGTVTVNKNGVLGGPGTIKGKVIVNGGLDARGEVRIVPEGGTGVMTLAGGLDMSAGGEYVWSLGTNSDANPGLDFDLISILSGALTLGGDSTLSILFTGTSTPPDVFDPFWRASHIWKIIDVADPLQNGSLLGFSSLEDSVYSAGSFSTYVGTDADAGDIFLRFSPAVPEPPGLLLLITGVAGLLAVGWRRKKHAQLLRAIGPDLRLIRDPFLGQIHWH